MTKFDFEFEQPKTTKPQNPKTPKPQNPVTALNIDKIYICHWKLFENNLKKCCVRAVFE